MDVDPYKLLDVPKNFTPDQLKAAYKKKALMTHPDKNGGSDYMFKLMTAAYKTLVKEYNRKIADKQYHELKNESRNYVAKHTPVTDAEAKRNFNIDKFNQVFEDNKLPDAVAATGYDDWLRSADDSEAATQAAMKPKKFNISNFNSQFESTNKAPPSKHLIKYKEPEPMFAGKKIQFTELGVEGVDDYSAENLSRKNLNYMDLKLAHTTSRIVDPKTCGERKEYKSVDALKSDRSSINYQMSDADLQAYHKKKKLEELQEQKRAENLMKYDRLVLEQFERTNRLMLGR